MKILIDADGCPVVNITAEIANKKALECIIICDTSHVFEKSGVKTITVSKGMDSADFALVNLIEKGDIVITQDYGLAAMCIAKNADVISQNGLIYDDENIISLLTQRHAAKKIRMSGQRLKGSPKRTKKNNDDFIKTLNELISKKIL